MNIKELCAQLTARIGVPYNTLFGWQNSGYIPKKDIYTNDDLIGILNKIPYCKECGKRLRIGTLFPVCSKCNAEIKTTCVKCGKEVHKYFNRQMVENPVCRKCALNTPNVTAVIKAAACLSWSLHKKERSAAVKKAVQMPEHRAKMKKISTEIWSAPEYKNKLKHSLAAAASRKWEEEGQREYPHSTRLSTHVFRCRHCANVYIDWNLDNSRQPSVNYCPHCRDTFSGPEKIIEKYLRISNIEYVQHMRPKWLLGKELDFYLPKHSLAIEVNGVFFHSEACGKGRMYHLEKTMACEENGIHLIHIWDVELLQKWNIIEDRLNSLLGKNTQRIGARACCMSEITSESAREFLDSNHIQGYTPCNTYCGMWHEEKLVGVAAFHKGRTGNADEWELARYASLLGVHIAGGMSRAVKWFCRKNPGVPLISYADRRWTTFSHNAYSYFHFIRKTPPAYFYAYHGKIYRREKFMKKHLAKNPITAHTYIPGMTERECCEKIKGLYKIWDCGQLVYRLV